MCVNSACKSEKCMWVRSQHLEIMTCEENKVKMFIRNYTLNPLQSTQFLGLYWTTKH